MSEQLSLFNEGEMNSMKEIKDPEWCYQFFDNEPVVIGFSKDASNAGNLIIELKPNEEDILVFKQNGMEFKIFAREISEESKKIREQQNQQQNAGENQEAAQ